MKFKLLSQAICAPGIDSFSEFTQLIADNKKPDTSLPLAKYSPIFLPANERRRTTATIKLALKVAEEAIENLTKSYPDINTQQLPVLFVSKDGDTLIAANMCEAVADEEPMISPIQFHNSVHNAPAGYWMIGQKNQAEASAISAGNASVANGILEAFLQSKAGKTPVLLVCYDLAIDNRISPSLTQPLPFGCAWVIEAESSQENIASPSLSMKLENLTSPIKTHPNPYQGLPAADFYPIIVALAQQKKSTFLLPFNPQRGLTLSIYHD